MRLIDADELEAHINKRMPMLYFAIHVMIAEISPVDETVTDFADRRRECGKVKMGKWIKRSPAIVYQCSICGGCFIPDVIDAPKSCHQCGASMEVDE